MDDKICLPDSRDAMKAWLSSLILKIQVFLKVLWPFKKEG